MKMLIVRCIYCGIIFLLLYTLNVIFPDVIFYCFSNIANIILYVLVAIIVYRHSYYLQGDELVSSDQKAILITGCDTGFGNLLAKKLDLKGFHVFASCLFPDGEGARQLKQSCSDRMHVIYLDVTKDDTVERAVQFVKKNLRSNALWAVVNNAGIAKGFSIDFTSIDDIKDTFDVNVFGLVRVTKAFLPLLKKSNGRVVNVTSVLARISTVDICAYVMSKHAALAFTEVLSLEMKAWGVHAISIEPEVFKTPMTEFKHNFERLETDASKMPTEILSSYGGEEYLEKLKKVITKIAILRCSDIDIVVETIIKAVTQKYPNHVYKPRQNIITRFFYFLLEIMPFELYEQVIFIILKILWYPVPKDTINFKWQN